MPTNSLPGIIKIGWLPLYRITPDIRMKSLAGLPVAVLADINFIKFSGVPECECETSVLNNGLTQSLTLSFSTAGEIPPVREIGWVLFTAGGGKFLVGARERPYPVWSATLNTGTPGGNPAVYSVKVRLKSVRSLIPVAL